MQIQTPLRITKGNNYNRISHSPYACIKSICLVFMNVWCDARCDEIPSMTLQGIKETKRYEHTDGRTDGQSENSIPFTDTVCRGYKIHRLP